nr:hypothetical protein GPGIFMOB_00124 [Acinetobacter gerneri]
MIFSSIFTGLFMTVGFTALIYNYVLMGGNSGLFFLVWGGGFSSRIVFPLPRNNWENWVAETALCS